MEKRVKLPVVESPGGAPPAPGAEHFLRREFLAKERLAILSLNRACDLTCTYCRGEDDDWYDKMAEGSATKNMPRAAWPRFAELCAQMGVAEVLLTGGEPTLYPHLNDFVVFLKDHGIRFAVHTHGLTRHVGRFLAHLERNRLVPNVHVSSELFEDHQRELRGSPLPLEFIGAARAIGCRVELKVVMHQRLAPRLEQARERLHWWVARGVDSIRFQPVADAGDDQGGALTLTREFVPFLELLRELKSNDPALAAVIRNSPASFDNTISMLTGAALHAEAARRCRIVDRIVFITTDFQLLDCKTLWRKKQGVGCDEIFDLVCCGYQS